MTKDMQDDGGVATPTLEREVCDKCGGRRTGSSGGSAPGAGRWSGSTATPRSGAGSRSTGGSPGTTRLTRSTTEVGERIRRVGRRIYERVRMPGFGVRRGRRGRRAVPTRVARNGSVAIAYDIR